MTRLREACAARKQTVARLETDCRDLTARLSEREAEVKASSAALAQAERGLLERNAQVEQLSRLYEESSLTSSNHQVELVARDADIDRLNDAIGLLRTQRKDAERAMREAMAQKERIEEALEAERKRSGELDRKVERMMTNISTRDEKLERREKEIARLKQKIRDSGDGSRPLAEVDQARERVEMQAADLSPQMSSLLAREDGSAGKAAASKKSEVERLRSRIATLMRENKKLRAERATPYAGADDEALREQISSLAAEVVSMASVLEGPDSPIEQALSRPDDAAEGADDRSPSLAERIRALRQGSPRAE